MGPGLRAHKGARPLMSRAALGPARTGHPGPARVPRSSPGASTVGSVPLTRAQHVTSAGTRRTAERPREVLSSLQKSCLVWGPAQSIPKTRSSPKPFRASFPGHTSCRATAVASGAARPGANARPLGPQGGGSRDPWGAERTPAGEGRDGDGPVTDLSSPSSLASLPPPGQPCGLSCPPPWARLRVGAWARPGG